MECVDQSGDVSVGSLPLVSNRECMRGFQGEYSPYAKRKPQLSEQSLRHRQVRVEGGGFHSLISNRHLSGRDTETETNKGKRY